MKSLDKKRFAREYDREERDDISAEDVSDALKDVMAGPQQMPPTKREPTAKQLRMRFKLMREKR